MPAAPPEYVAFGYGNLHDLQPLSGISQPVFWSGIPLLQQPASAQNVVLSSPPQERKIEKATAPFTPHASEWHYAIQGTYREHPPRGTSHASLAKKQSQGDSRRSVCPDARLTSQRELSSLRSYAVPLTRAARAPDEDKRSGSACVARPRKSADDPRSESLTMILAQRFFPGYGDAACPAPMRSYTYTRRAHARLPVSRTCTIHRVSPGQPVHHPTTQTPSTPLSPPRVSSNPFFSMQPCAAAASSSSSLVLVPPCPPAQVSTLLPECGMEAVVPLLCPVPRPARGAVITAREGREL